MENASSRTRSDSALVDHGDSNAWLSRTHFSRCVCYRINGSDFPFLSVPLPQEVNTDSSFGNSSKGYTKLCDMSIIQDDLSKDCFRSFNSPGQDMEPSRASSSAKTSPEHAGAVTPRRSRQYARSLSLETGIGMASNRGMDMTPNGDADGFYDCAQAALGEGHLSETKVHNGESDVARAVSWSEYFETQGNECAVEEAEDWMIDLSELYLGHKFASGAYSRLYLGQYQNSEVAVKISRQPDDNEEVSMRLERQFRSEVGVLSRVHHRNIIKFVGACRKPPVCCILTEYLALGSVRTYLHNQLPFSLSLKMVVDMAFDIAQGMEYLHSQGVIHRDLKSENLLLTDDLCVKITDFGVACFESDITNMTSDVGTYRWMAPEMIRSKHFSRKADVYSFGIVVWELLTGHTPFEELSPIQAAFAVVHKHARPPLPLNCPSALGLLMHQCWSTDPNKRPEFSKVVEVLRDMKEYAQLDRNMSIFRRPHKHHHPFLHCFGLCTSKNTLSPI